MNLKELSNWLEAQLIEHPEWKRLQIVSIDDVWLPKTLEIEAYEGYAAIKQTAGYQEL